MIGREFRVGDWVVCINNRDSDVLQVGKAYKITDIMSGGSLCFEDSDLPEKSQRGWFPHRFHLQGEIPPDDALYVETPEIAEIRAQFINHGEVDAGS